uniref:N-acetylglucosaminyltransferase (Fragments) n=1 Tax=Rhizobium sp. (strain MPIK3030) TaxID=393 RepID=NODC_RHISM|nr:RecName: Full=N-acetylglucosaminyltransferase; AltName: Full=Nodulation protein C [Rhizobium sp. MPIK3030]
GSARVSACVASIAKQDYAGELRVYVVDDGSGNRNAIIPVHDHYACDPRFRFILMPKNVGKRKASIVAIGKSSGDLVLNVDSDTTMRRRVASKLASKSRIREDAPTILMRNAGFRTEYVPEAIAETVVPNSMNAYLRQQRRWARSSFADTLAVLLLLGLDRYLTLDEIGGNLGPLLLALSVVSGLAQLALTATVPWS